MGAWRALLDPADVQGGRPEVHLIPAQLHQFGNPEAVPVGHEDHRRVPMTVAAFISRSTSASVRYSRVRRSPFRRGVGATVRFLAIGHRPEVRFSHQFQPLRSRVVRINQMHVVRLPKSLPAIFPSALLARALADGSYRRRAAGAALSLPYGSSCGGLWHSSVRLKMKVFTRGTSGPIMRSAGVVADRSDVLRWDTFLLSMPGLTSFPFLLRAHLNAFREARRAEPRSLVPRRN
jgi:hypothetical protein